MDDMHYQKTSKARLVEMHKAQGGTIQHLWKRAMEAEKKLAAVLQNNAFLRDELDAYRKQLDEVNEYINDLHSGNP